MEPHVFLAVLAGAAMHAAWNAVLKFGGDRMVTMGIIALGHGIPAVLLLPFTGSVNPDCLPYLAASTLLHVGYRVFLVKAYEAGDMSQVYPLARGSAPLLTTLLGVTVIGESVSAPALLGILTIGAGIALMSLKGGVALARIAPRALGFAMLTALFICAYTLSDGLGARASRNPHAYAALLFAIDTPVTLLLVYAMRGKAMLAGMREHMGKGLIGGALSLGSYWIAIWAMTVAPIPLVAALRETSVLFGVIIAAVLLGERITWARGLAALLIVTGAVLMRTG
jgi:uncharacterized membrane protein